MGERPPEPTRARVQQTAIGVFVIFWGCVLLGYICLRLYGVPEAVTRLLGPRGAAALDAAVWLVVVLLYFLVHGAMKRRTKTAR